MQFKDFSCYEKAAEYIKPTVTTYELEENNLALLGDLSK